MAFRWKQMDFISDIDQHFQEWKKSMTPSTSQKIETEKYNRINAMRDQPQETDSDPSFLD